MKNYFPFNYIYTIISPVRCFTNRGYLTWWQRGLLFLLMMSFVIFPLSVHIANREFVDLEDYYPGIVEEFNPALIEQLPLSNFEDGRFTNLDSTIYQENQDFIVAAASSKQEAEQLLKDKNGLILTPSYFFIRDKGAEALGQPYLSEGKLNQVSNPSQFQFELSRYWFEFNRLAIVLNLLVNVYVLMSLNLSGIILAGSFFIWLMGFYENFDIDSYSEALDITFNTMGLPIVLVMLIAFITGDPIWVMSGQGIGFLLMFMLTMWRTHLNDEYTRRNSMK